MSEANFKIRLKRILSCKGYWFITIPMPRRGGHPIDVIAVKRQIAFPIEVKGKNTYYPPKQKMEQLTLCGRGNSGMFLIRQGKTRGNIHVTPLRVDAPGMKEATALLLDDLKEYL